MEERNACVDGLNSAQRAASCSTRTTSFCSRISRLAIRAATCPALTRSSLWSGARRPERSSKVTPPPQPDPRYPMPPKWNRELRQLAPNVYAYVQGGGPGISAAGVSNAGVIVSVGGTAAADHASEWRAGRIVETFGEPLDPSTGCEPDRLFPRPEALADAPLEKLGIIGSRADTIRRLAHEVSSGNIDFSGAGMVEKLTALPGIGDWTAQYVALRSGVDPDAFPASDLGLLRGAEDGEKMTPARLRRRAEAWRPWRAYAALCLWRRYAELRI